jgi:polyphenol oxidase
MVRFEYLEGLGVAAAAISDRRDGDCALRAPHDAAVFDNRATVCRNCGVKAEALAGAAQVHGHHVAVVSHAHAGSGLTLARALPDTDGLATAERTLPLSITVADCVPVFLVDAEAGLATLLHAGRVGTQDNICAEGVRVLVGLGAVTTRIHALIGPSAGPCCYEVSTALAAELEHCGLVVRGRHADLWESNRRQLRRAGLSLAQIVIDGRCTICDGGFHSHRAHADGKRNMALLAL